MLKLLTVPAIILTALVGASAAEARIESITHRTYTTTSDPHQCLIGLVALALREHGYASYYALTVQDSEWWNRDSAAEASARKGTTIGLYRVYGEISTPAGTHQVNGYAKYAYSNQHDAGGKLLSSTCWFPRTSYGNAELHIADVEANGIIVSHPKLR